MADLEFSEPKPFPFPMRMDLRTIKQWDLEIDPSADGLSFEKVFQKMTDTQKANVVAAREIQGIYEGASFLPREDLASIEQTGTTFNFEDVASPTYVDYAAALKKIDKKDKGLEEDLFGKNATSEAQENPGAGNTMAHNLSLLNGITTNPFKKEDTKNYNAFLNSPYYKDLHTNMQSPRRILQKLDPQFWKKINDATKQATTYGLSSQTIQGAADPFSDNKGSINTFDVQNNFHSTLSSKAWKGWDASLVFGFLNRAWESRTRVENILREMVGNAKDLPSKNDPNISQPVMDHVENWWQKTGSHLEESALLPFASLASIAPAMSKFMDWGNWGDNPLQPSASGFREKIVSDYLDYANFNYVSTQFKNNRPVVAQDFAFDSQAEGDRIFQSLVSKNWISSSGMVSPTLTSTALDAPLGLGFASDKELRIRKILKEALIGDLSLEFQDQSLVNGKQRYNFKLKGSDGQSRDLMDVVGLIGKGKTAFEKMQNTQLAYDYLMTINRSLTHGIPATTSQGDALAYRVVDKKIEVVAYPSAQWDEWSTSNQKIGWQTIEDKPASIQFNSLQEATDFKDKIRMLTALIEPLAVMFSPDENKAKGIPVLVDNSQSTTLENPAYHVQEDLSFSPEFFDSTTWKQASKDITLRVGETLQNRIMQRTIGNKTFRDRHTEKIEEYKTKKEDFEDEAARQTLREKEEATLRHEEEMKQEAIRKAEEMRLKQEELKRQEENRAREQAESASS